MHPYLAFLLLCVHTILVSLKCHYSKGHTSGISGPIVKIIAFLESKSGLFFKEQGIFQFEQLNILAIHHLYAVVGVSALVHFIICDLNKIKINVSCLTKISCQKRELVCNLNCQNKTCLDVSSLK